jgi:hypothetical protein
MASCAWRAFFSTGAPWLPATALLPRPDWSAQSCALPLPLTVMPTVSSSHTQSPGSDLGVHTPPSAAASVDASGCDASSGLQTHGPTPVPAELQIAVPPHTFRPVHTTVIPDVQNGPVSFCELSQASATAKASSAMRLAVMPVTRPMPFSSSTRGVHR